MIIKNFQSLAITDERKILLELLEVGLKAIDYKTELKKIGLDSGKIITDSYEYFLDDFKRIYIIGFGKGSSFIAYEIFKNLKEKYQINGCFVIDFKYEEFEDKNFVFFEGTHPLLSENNFKATKYILDYLTREKLTEDDLVIVVICGGGSSMFVFPAKISLEEKIDLTKKLLTCGANIEKINIVRKHLSLVKGGGLAGFLYPARVISFIVSDVPGDDISFVASGPTCFDSTTKQDALDILKYYKIELDEDKLIETPKDPKIFAKVDNFLFLNNQKVLNAILKKAKEMNLKAKICESSVNCSTEKLTNRIFEDLKESYDLFIYGGETTVQVKKPGKGGRNQDLVLRVLEKMDSKELTILAFNTDGWDNTEFGGAIGDRNTIKKAQELNFPISEAIEENKSFEFFQKTGDGILTGRLPINVSDVILVLKK